MTVVFGLREPAVSLEAPDALERAVTGLFPRYLLPHDPPIVDPAALPVRLRVGEEADGWTMWAEGALSNRLPPERFVDRVELLCRLEVALATALLGRYPTLVHLHAAGAALPCGVTLVFGDADAGKSSVALAWSVAGHALLGDDILLLDDAGRVRPFFRLLKVDRARLDAHGIDPRGTPHFSPTYRHAWFDPSEAGGWHQGPARPVLLAFLRRGSGAGPKIEAMDSAEALNHLLGAVHRTGRPPAEAVDPFRAVLRRARAVRLHYRSSDRAAAALAEWSASPSVVPGLERG